MCDWGGDDAANAAREAARAEDERQLRIRQGMHELDLMFGGSKKVPGGKLGMDAPMAPERSYYDQSGGLWDMQSWLQDTTDKAVAQHLLSGSRADIDADIQGAWQQRLGQGLYGELVDSPEPGGFGPVYDRAYDAQLNYALPEVDRQFKDAQRQLDYGLARTGLSASSQGSQLGADLERQRQSAVQGEQEKAEGARQDQMAAVDTERDNLARMLQATGDLSAVKNMATNKRALLEAAPPLQQVQPLFQNATGALADVFVPPAVRQAQQSRPVSGYGATRGSGRVVN